MYQPPHFREDDLEIQQALIRKYPLGILVTAGAGGLMANPIPFILDAAASERGTLRAHLSRGNPQAKELATAQECMVVFQGPQEYITPSWYATKKETGKVVPTWNYATVHIWSRPQLMEDPRWLVSHLHELTQYHEAHRPEPWQIEDAPEAFTAALMKGIIGFEFVIDRIEGKWKVSQNRPEADRRSVHAGLCEQGAASQDMAELVARYGKLEDA